MSGKEFLSNEWAIVRQIAMPGFGVKTESFLAPASFNSQVNRREVRKTHNKSNEVVVWRGETILVGRNIPAREPSGITKTCECGLPLHFDRVYLGHVRKNGVELQNVIKIFSALRCPDHKIRGVSKIFIVNTDTTTIKKYQDPSEKSKKP